MTNTRRIQIVIGLLMALGLPFCHLGDLGRKFSGLGDLMGGEVLWWGLFAAIILYVLLVERMPLSSIGYRAPGLGDVAAAVAMAVVAFIGIGMIFQLVLPALHMTLDKQLSGLYATPLWFRILTVTRAAVVEETAFRGYGFDRLSELTGSRTLAALATWALFTMAHLSHWGWAQVIVAAFGGLVLTALYMWRGNLWANIICHWITDGVGFIVMPLFAAHH